MWVLEAIIYRAIRLMHASQFVICYLAYHIMAQAQMFTAEQARIERSSHS